MAENSGIQWTDHTFNAWRGCLKIATGCTNCYAEALSGRNPGTLGRWGSEVQGGTRVVAAESAWRAPLRWERQAAESGQPTRVFGGSLMDWAEDWGGPMLGARGDEMLVNNDGLWWQDGDTVEDDWGCRPLTMDDVRARLCRLIDQTPHLTWQLLTKRPENIRRFWTPVSGTEDATTKTRPLHRPNVHLIASVACQEDADRVVPELLRCRDLSPVLGLSCEPLVGPVDLSKWLDQLDWIICGGES